MITEETPDDAQDDAAGGKVSDAVRADIAGEPGPADPDLRAKALDPNEASVDVADDPDAADVPTAYEDGTAVDPDDDPSADTEDENPSLPETDPDAPLHQDDDA